jgi:FkbM family methyltransferase
MENILRISSENPVFAPDVPVAGTGLFTREFIKLHDDEFTSVYNSLADEHSREVYVNVLNFKVSGKTEYLFPLDDKREVYRDILSLSDDETIVDLGAYDGDTIREFTTATNGYKKIYAVEPDKKNFKKLTKNTSHMENVTLFNFGAWNKCESVNFGSKAGRNSAVGVSGTLTPMNSVDNLINESVTLIKMDIEGSELHAIEGAKRTIKAYRPKLYICAYHRNEDMFAIPLAVKKIEPDYKLYFRHHDYIPAWESNFYFIP